MITLPSREMNQLSRNGKYGTSPTFTEQGDSWCKEYGEKDNESSTRRNLT